MPFLRCTSKLLADIDDSPSPDSSTPSPLGDWYGHLFSVQHRKCIIFINEPTLFVCPAFGLVKADYRQIVPFFLESLTCALYYVECPGKETEWILGLHQNLSIGPTVNRSTVASLNNRIANAKATFLWHGGFGHCDIGALTVLLNQTPMKPIGYSNGFKKMQALVDRSLNRPAREKIRPVPEPEMPCAFCGKPLRRAQAQQCFHCGADWRGTSRNESQTPRPRHP